MNAPTLFTRIIDGELPATRVYEDEHCVVIQDIKPAAPIHLLIIPRKPLPQISHATAEDQALLGHLLLVANRVAADHGIADAFKLAVNNGEGAGQEVPHLHIHLLGGFNR